MIAVDTNLLVYSHRRDSESHELAFARIKELTESGTDWCIPWPCIHEFLAIVTHPKIYRPPSTNQQAVHQAELWMECPTLRLLGEGRHYWPRLRELALSSKIKGPIFHDARIAALCLESGVTALWTADRDFSLFPGIRVENPLQK